MDRGGKVFNRSAPVIKLKDGASEDDHLGLVGLLNSSVACFWMQQVFHNKGGPGGGCSKDEKWHDFFEHDGTKLRRFPIPVGRPIEISRRLDSLSSEMADHLPAACLVGGGDVANRLRAAKQAYEVLRGEAIALQEELDWQCYGLYELADESLTLRPGAIPRIQLGQRAFEIALARRVLAGELETSWFAVHGSTPITEIPNHWPAEYRAVVQRRLDAIAADPDIALIERPEYKRRWADEPWAVKEKRALREWLLDRLEQAAVWPAPALQSCRQLADRVAANQDFRAAAELYRGQAAIDLVKLVEDLVLEEAVPFAAAFRYAASGRRKRAEWEATWERQRAEDAIDARTSLPRTDPRRLELDEAKRLKAAEIGAIPVPPKYENKDFAKASYWKLRGKLDVPKERFILYSGAERGPDDPSPVVGWAGWDHLQQAQALATYYEDRRLQAGWPAERLFPLLVGLAELLPWLRQWHNEIDPESGERLGDYFTAFTESEARRHGYTLDALSSWSPPLTNRRAARGPRANR